jgi:hypothetical protein
MSQKPKVKILFYQTYLSVIRNSVQSHLFRDLYALVNGRTKNITKKGQLSCAFFVSSILKIFGLIDELCPTVHGLMKNLEKSGWRRVEKPRPGAIIIWQAEKFSDGSVHKHSGFYLGKNMAISNSFKERCPIIHHLTFNKKRKIEAIYWNFKLKNKRIN